MARAGGLGFGCTGMHALETSNPKNDDRDKQTRAHARQVSDHLQSENMHTDTKNRRTCQITTLMMITSKSKMVLPLQIPTARQIPVHSPT